MREFYFPISDTFTNGLRPRPETGKAAGFLVRSMNLVPGPINSTVPDTVFAEPLDIPSNWPFPQASLEHGVVLGEDSIYSLLDDLTTSYISTIVSGYEPSSTSTITPGGAWDIAGVGREAWVATNSETVLVKTPGYDNILAFQEPCRACTLYGDRIVLEVSSSFWTDNLFGQSLYDEWKKANINSSLIPSNPSEVSWLLVTRPVSSDLDYPLLADLACANMAPNWLYSDAGGYIKDNVRLGAVQLIPVYSSGNIVALESCAGYLLVLLEDEVLYTDRIDRPLVKLTSSGVRNRGASITSPGGIGQTTCWASTEKLFVFEPDARGQYRVVPLGYEEHLQPHDSPDPTILSYDHGKSHFYIGHPDGCLIRSPQGVGQTNRIPTTLIRTDKLYGVFSEDCFSPYIEFETTEFDMNMQAFKTITTIELGGSGISDLAFSTTSRLDQTGERMYEGRLVLAGDWGVSFMRQAGLAFRLYGQGFIQREGAEVDYVTVKWKSTDKRSVRGPHSPAAERREQSGGRG